MTSGTTAEGPRPWLESDIDRLARELHEKGEAAERTYFHQTPSPNACEHDFQGWRELEDGSGGEQVCTKCGIGAMTYSIMVGL